MKIVDYDESLSQAVRELSAECFIDSPFYAAYKENGDIGRRELSKLFDYSMKLCAEIGTAKCAVIDGEIVGLIMGFDYAYVKAHHPDKFAFFFTDGNEEGQNDILNEDLTVIDKAVADSAKSAYLMIVAVSRARRNSGIASKLIEAFSDVYAGCDIVTDVVSESMEHLCKKYGFEKYGTAADCSVYLRKADFLH